MSKYNNTLPAGFEDDDEVEDFDYYMTQCSNSSSNQPVNLSSQLQNTNGVKIIPNVPTGVGAGLNKSNFNIQLDANAQKWFDRIHQYWKQFKKSPVLSNDIQKFYAGSSNPFVHALMFFANTNDHLIPKSNTFAFTILEELLNFKKSTNLDTKSLLDDNIKMVAFNFVYKSGQTTTFKLVVEIFELVKSKKLFVSKIKELIAAKQFKDAGQIACDLKLFNEFTMEDFLIPLILEDKLGIFEDYLDKAEHLRMPTIKLLDSFLHRDTTVRQMCDRFIAKYDLKDVKYEKLHKKPISKLISRLTKKYQLPDEIAPNMKKHKEFGSLHFILRKNYIEKSLNKASFEEMVKDTIGKENKDLQVELVHTCLTYGSKDDAVDWTNYYEIPLEKVPPIVRDTILGIAEKPKIDSGWDDENDDNENSDKDNENVSITPQKSKEKVEEIHTLPLDPSRIVVVNTIPLYRTMINDLSSTKMIAFDTEWKPTILSCNNVSLIQLAHRDLIYLVDVITLTQEKMCDEDWGLLGKWIFNNDEILKLGFAHSTDISMLMKFQPLGIQSSQQSSHSYLDLQGLWQKVSNFPDFKFPFHDDDLPSHSLSNLVKLCFGKKLDKSNQFSNWQQRPLRDEQILYAALDAYCLFEIYDVIGNVISNMGINFDQLIDNILIENKKQIASMTKKESRQQKHSQIVEQIQIIRKPVNVNEIRFVTDFMIGSIGRLLRQIGVDTIILKGDSADHDECIKYSQRDDRIILTASQQLFINRYNKHAKHGNTFLINKHHNELEGLQEVVKHFKINVKRFNVFSRCMNCNCDEFLVASKLQMIKLKFDVVSDIPDELQKFFKDPEQFDRIEFPEFKRLSKWTRYAGQTMTKNKTNIKAMMADGTLRVFQTFYICELCTKIYWDGGHYHNNCGGKLDFIFNLFPEAEIEKK
ncbi:CLUMA_CG017229, isoform A [Clunio marinus]|uniref:CLUMA_CG017229, isoform A n=1 Tax=Clunio marinus TaxID=568069 RepID=A0A1J1IV78_9DIPT|nr:CLUMA_CG017229, isoform A [Clunio marinus]